MPFTPLRRRCLSLALLAVLSACAGTPTAPPAALIDAQIGSDYNGVVLVRAKRGAAALVKAYGKAQFEMPASLAPDARFMIGSVSKWITAVTVLRLVEEKQLDLDKPVTTWLPELPATSRAVTLRTLLSNTSGIENGLNLAMKRDRSPERMTISATQAALKFGSGPLSFAPGTKFDYSVTNWLIIAGAVERATGEPFSRTVARLVFEPAGVRDTGFADQEYATLPRMAVAYATTKTVRKTPPAPPMVAASGTIYSTASDLVKIADAVYGNGLLTPASRRELLTVQHAPEEYALGGRIKQLGSGAGMRTLAWETGVSGGYKTLLAYSPVDGRTVVLLNNTDMAQSEQARIGLALLGALDR
ncbi:serine hydrolase domain-containing protein [Massilia sp. CMS3.1]|uniref:serine hydrolase domain-containing protein n=1 Tax=Massilia sp. CMS3.1 TaxID=3373083 RepID=UPI003EE5D65F